MYIKFDFSEVWYPGLFYDDPEAYVAIIKNRIVEGLGNSPVAHNHLDLGDIHVLDEGRVEIKAVGEFTEIHDCVVITDLLMRALH